MDFMTAVRTCLSKYVDFSGRARRSEYWWFVLFNVLVSIVASVIDLIVGTDFASGGGVFQWIASLALFLPGLAAGVRRLHDTGRSGWWILIGLIPIVGWIILIVWYCADSKPGANEYGPNPKEDQPGAYPPPAYGTGQYEG